MSKHAAPEEAEQVEAPAPRRKLFCQDNLPHFAMLILFITWLYFQITLGTAAVPPAINTSFAAISGLWFSYVIRDQVKSGETK